MCKDGRCPSCCFMNASEEFPLWERTEAQTNPYLYYSTKIYLQMTSKTCLKTTKAKKYKAESESSSDWLRWSRYHPCHFEGCLPCEDVSSCSPRAVDLPYLKVHIVGVCEQLTLTSRGLSSVLWIWQFCSVWDAAVWGALRTFMPCHVVLFRCKWVFCFVFLPQSSK